MSPADDTVEIGNIINTYEKAVNTGNADLLESLFWYDDTRFSEVENDRPQPFGREEFLLIGDWIRNHGKPPRFQHFSNTRIFLLSVETAYSVSMRKEKGEQDSRLSRVTMIYLKYDSTWKIIHGHFSLVP